MTAGYLQLHLGSRLVIPTRCCEWLVNNIVTRAPHTQPATLLLEAQQALRFGDVAAARFLHGQDEETADDEEANEHTENDRIATGEEQDLRPRNAFPNAGPLKEPSATR